MPEANLFATVQEGKLLVKQYRATLANTGNDWLRTITPKNAESSNWCELRSDRPQSTDPALYDYIAALRYGGVGMQQYWSSSVGVQR